MDEIIERDVDHATVDRCRRILGDEAIDLSDDEVDQIRRDADTIAHALIDAFVEERQTIEYR